MGWRGAGGLTSVPPAPSTHYLRGFHGKAGAGQGPLEPGRGDEGLSLWGSVCAPSGPSRRAWAGSLELHLGVQSALLHQACFL